MRARTRGGARARGGAAGGAVGLGALLLAALEGAPIAAQPPDPLSTAGVAETSHVAPESVPAAPTDTAGAAGPAADSLRAPADSLRAPAVPAPPPARAFDPSLALDAWSAVLTVREPGRVGRGVRTALEPLREGPAVALERFGLVGQSERLLVLGEPGASLRLAGVPVLSSRSGLAPFDVLPREMVRTLRVRRPAQDPLLAGRSPAGVLDAAAGPSTREGDPPLTGVLAMRGPFVFRRYAAGFDRWVGPVRGAVTYDTAHNERADGVRHTDGSGSFLALASRAEAGLPLSLLGGTTRREMDLVSGVAGGSSRGTEERSLVVLRAALALPAGGAARAFRTLRVAVKDDRVAWRAPAASGLRGRERESGAMVAAGEEGPVALAGWSYAGRVVDEIRGSARPTERAGASLVVSGARLATWRAFAGAERVSPVTARLHAGGSVERVFGAARVAVTAERSPDHPPRGLLLPDSALVPGSRTGLSVGLALGRGSGAADPDTGGAVLDLGVHRRWIDEGVLLVAADPFFGEVERETYADWGVSLDAAATLLGLRVSAGYLFLDDNAPRPLPLRPRHRGRAAIEARWTLPQPDARFAARVACEVVGARASFDRATRLEPIVDLRASARLQIETVALFIQVENLLDRFNEPIPFIYPEGRSAHLGFTWLLRD